MITVLAICILAGSVSVAAIGVTVTSPVAGVNCVGLTLTTPPGAIAPPVFTTTGSTGIPVGNTTDGSPDSTKGLSGVTPVTPVTCPCAFTVI